MDALTYNSAYVGSFIEIRDARIRQRVDEELQSGLLWTEPLIQLNPSFASGGSIEDLVDEGLLHAECRRIFRSGKADGEGRVLRLYTHQVDAIRAAHGGHNYVLTTGTGSGKSLAYIVPIVDHVLRTPATGHIRAVVVYPMNALANSQRGELEKFLCHGYPEAKGPVTFARYTGQESPEEKQAIIKRPPDILLTNYVMLELLLTRPDERPLIDAAQGLSFLVLDELHTYRGRQGADVAMLVRRTREAMIATGLQCVGTSATLAGAGTYEEQRREVARVASLLFGATVHPEHVIGETLERTTPDRNFDDDQSFVHDLAARISDDTVRPAKQYDAFVTDPLSVWIESTFGLARDAEGRLTRTTPRNVRGEQGAASALSALTGVSDERCAAVIEEQLLASYGSEPNPSTGFPVFAFRPHQFISRGDTVYASVEAETDRYITLQGQQFVPGDRSRVLLPLVFCRECGQEYYCVRQERLPEGAGTRYVARQLSERTSTHDSEIGFLYVNTTDPFPLDGAAMNERLPEDWLEEARGAVRVSRERREWIPQQTWVQPDGVEGAGADCRFVPAPFRFCLSCGVAYGFRQVSDFAKLAVLGTEGRSTATTILSLAAIQDLRTDEELDKTARKLLSFTDNRQDASLQAGHFNDFVEIGVLRSALYRAAAAVGPSGLGHDHLTQHVFDALGFNHPDAKRYYAADPSVRFQAEEETKRAMRAVLGYRLYRDLERGWRITSPNLEQSGLLEIDYLSLDDLCAAEDLWAEQHAALATASPGTRRTVAKTLLDFMRRELTIKVDFLEQTFQERMRLQSSQRLRSPWALDENEQLQHAGVLYPRSKRPKEYGGNVYLSPRGGFGQYLRRPSTFPDLNGRLNTRDAEVVCRNLLEVLRVAGLVEVVDAPRKADDAPGYQLPASAILWRATDGTRAFHDPIRVPRTPTTGGRTNRFFVDYYQHIAQHGQGLEAREHTAQVQYADRMDRENRFRAGELPILYCSPTMELGVDIAQLNAGQPPQHPPDPGELCPAQRTRGAEWPARDRLLVLLHLQFPRPVLLPPPAPHGFRGRLNSPAGPRERRLDPGARPRHLARGKHTRPAPLTGGGRRSQCRGSRPAPAGAGPLLRRPCRGPRARPRACQPDARQHPRRVGAGRLVQRRLARRSLAAGGAAVRRGVRPLAGPVSGRGAAAGTPARHYLGSLPHAGSSEGQAAPRRGRGADRPAHRRGALHRVRLLQLPVLRQRRLPARLQLPPAAPVRLHPRSSGQGRAR